MTKYIATRPRPLFPLLPHSPKLRFPATTRKNSNPQKRHQLRSNKQSGDKRPKRPKDQSDVANQKGTNQNQDTAHSKPPRLRHATGVALGSRSRHNTASPGRDSTAANQPRNSKHSREEGKGREEREGRDAALVVSKGAAGRDDLEGSRRRRRRVELAPGGSSGVRLGGVVQVEGGPPRVDVHDARVDVRVAVDGVRDGALAGRRRRRRRALEVGPVIGDATRTGSTSSNSGSIRRTSITASIIILRRLLLLLRWLRRRRGRRRINRHCGENASVRVGAVVVGPVVVQGGHELAADGRAHCVALVAEARDLLQVVVAARGPRRLVALFCKVFVGDLGAHCCSGEVEKRGEKRWWL
ncbi:hypothetical protein IWZ01DRAFT_562560 [Phyllosticta capitalensis]